MCFALITGWARRCFDDFFEPPRKRMVRRFVFQLRAQTVGLAIAAVGMASSIMHIHAGTLPVAITIGTPAIFIVLCICVHFLSGEFIAWTWAAVGLFGALANMANAPFIGEAELAEYLRSEPLRREGMHFGMLAIGSVHALFPFSRRVEIGIALWVFGCAFCQNAILYLRTDDLAFASRECLGVIIPFSMGMAITELLVHSLRRGVGAVRDADAAHNNELSQLVGEQEQEPDDGHDSNPRGGSLCDLSVEVLHIDWSARLGSGAMGDVHRGTWLGTAVAVKVVKDRWLQKTATGAGEHDVGGGGRASGRASAHDQSEGRGLVYSLRKEAKLLAQLRHPCICSVFGTLQLTGGHEAIVLEYMSGGTLADLLYHHHRDHSARDGMKASRTNGKEGEAAAARTLTRGASLAAVSTAISCRISRETASGLAYLHGHGCMHRDVKSSNVLLDERLHAKVAEGASHTQCPRTPTDASRTLLSLWHAPHCGVCLAVACCRWLTLASRSSVLVRARWPLAWRSTRRSWRGRTRSRTRATRSMSAPLATWHRSIRAPCAHSLRTLHSHACLSCVLRSRLSYTRCTHVWA